MAKRNITVEVTSGTPRTHLWCDTCMTSARFQVDMYAWFKDGPRQIATVEQCITCDYEETS